MQHHHPVAQAGDDAHQVLHQQDGDALRGDAADQVQRPLDLRGVQAGVHLIQQQHARTGSQALGHLQPFALRQGQGSRRSLRIGAEAHTLQHRPRRRPRQRQRPGGTGEQRPRRDIVQRRHFRKRLHDLIAARQAEPGDAMRRQPGDGAAIEGDPPARGDSAADRINERCLAGSVRTDQTQDLPRRTVSDTPASTWLPPNRTSGSRHPANRSCRGNSHLGRSSRDCHCEERSDAADPPLRAHRPTRLPRRYAPRNDRGRRSKSCRPPPKPADDAARQKQRQRDDQPPRTA